jgi:serine O-acetyltransferase
MNRVREVVTARIARRRTLRARTDRHPKLVPAIIADARITAARRGDRYEFRSTGDALLQALRLAFVADAFLAQCLYRLKARAQALGLPMLPRVAHWLAMVLAQVSIGDPVVIEAGVYIVHGSVVIDGLVEIGRGTTIAPFVTIGLLERDFIGPTIGHHVEIGTGAKILGPVRVGPNARIGANAVVLDDVPAGATAVGVPARIVSRCASD